MDIDLDETGDLAGKNVADFPARAFGLVFMLPAPVVGLFNAPGPVLSGYGSRLFFFSVIGIVFTLRVTPGNDRF